MAVGYICSVFKHKSKHSLEVYFGLLPRAVFECGLTLQLIRVDCSRFHYIFFLLKERKKKLHPNPGHASHADLSINAKYHWNGNGIRKRLNAYIIKTDVGSEDHTK